LLARGGFVAAHDCNRYKISHHPKRRPSPEAYEAAAETEAELGLEHGRAQSLQIAGKAAFLGGDFQQADTHFRNALALHEKLDQLISATKARANMAAVAFQQEDYPEAYEIARSCARIAHKQNHLAEAAGAIRTMSMVLLEQGRLPRAFKTIRCALVLHTTSHSRAEMIEDVLGVAKIFLKDRQIDVAEGCLAQAEQWTADHGQPHHRRQCQVFRRLIVDLKT
jgi:tetratricopeptide (TPR) repeat protein